jgi:putative ABC transport system substrate-binding protein
MKLGRAALLVLLAVGVLLVPLAAEAQRAGKVYRVGRLGGAVLPENEAFREGLRELGYVEGKDLTIEYRSADPDLGRLPTLAAELVTLGVDVIVAVGNQAILAAKSATTIIPIVGLAVLEPVETGIVG